MKVKFRAYEQEQESFKLQVAEEDGGDGGGGDGKGGANNVDVQKLIQEAVDREVAGLKAKNQELLASNATFKEKMKAFDGLDVARIRELQSRIDEDEDLKLFQEGKKDQVIEKHTARMRDQHKAELAEMEARIQEANGRADTYKGAVLENQIRAVTNGMHPSAVEDALLLGRTIFQLDAKGRAVKLDSEGRPELGKDGSTPFSPAEWIESMKEAKPHWFPAQNSGSGSGNTREGGGSGKSISRAAFDKLDTVQQATVVRSGTKIVD